jgi:uncharacterized radical SAM protein YgiQ
MGETEGSRFSATRRRRDRNRNALPVVQSNGHPYPFLPTNRAELDARGWDEVDIVIVSGDAHVDHPAFGPLLIARFLEGRGFRVGVICQPNWHSTDAFMALGKPRLFFGVAAGNMDSMLNRLTAQKKNRSEDQYSPGGETGLRPDRATVVYAQRCREAYKGVPVVIGGIEASLRRIAHYDYWADKVRRSVLMDSKADLLVFGMGERPVWAIAKRLRDGEPLSALTDIRGTAYIVNRDRVAELAADPSRFVPDGKPVALPSYEEVSTDKVAYARATRLFQRETNPGNARPLFQPHGERAVYYNPPAFPLTSEEGVGEDVAMDELYDLPFNRVPHPMYNATVPAYETVKHSIVLMRGCFGGCTFCSITEHEGRIIQSRSAKSVMREVRELRRMDNFRGTITDLGGPTANMYKMACKSAAIESNCRRLSCVHPGVCENLNVDHGPVRDVMQQVREADGVKHVFIASGVRYDLAELDPKYVADLAKHHVGGHLSVAPEHVSDRVLDKMKKPGIAAYERFQTMFQCASSNAGKEQYEIPYFISGHPGCDTHDMIQLALWLKANGYRPRQVQDFIPTPMSVASAMYYTGIDPLTMEPVYVATGLREKKMQKALLLYWNKEHWPLAREALRAVKRDDLIGHGPECLVPSERRELPTPVERTTERRGKSGPRQRGKSKPKGRGARNKPRRQR